MQKVWWALGEYMTSPVSYTCLYEAKHLFVTYGVLSWIRGDMKSVANTRRQLQNTKRRYLDSIQNIHRLYQIARCINYQYMNTVCQKMLLEILLNASDVNWAKVHWSPAQDQTLAPSFSTKPATALRCPEWQKGKTRGPEETTLAKGAGIVSAPS